MIVIPTLTQLYNGVLADLNASFGDSIPLFGRVYLRAQAMVQAGKLKIQYVLLAKIQKNMFVDTADPEAQGGTLEQGGRLKLGRNPNPATSGQYQVTVTGTVGSLIKASQTFKSNDDSINPGMFFVLDNNYILVTSVDSIILRALTPGIGSKLSVGNGLTATSPIANVNSIVVVAVETVQPLDAENIEDYRQLAIQAYRDEPQGGAPTDYRLWSFDAQGVAQTYPYAKTGGVNEVNLYVEAIAADSVDGKGTPSAFILAAVQTVVEFNPDTTLALNQRGRRPVGVIVHYLPVTVRNVSINIAGYVGITSAIQAEILASIQELISTVRPFVAAADVLADKNDILSNNTVISAILQAVPGSVFGAITLSIDGNTYTSFQFLLGDIPSLLNINPITYIG